MNQKTMRPLDDLKRETATEISQVAVRKWRSRAIRVAKIVLALFIVATILSAIYSYSSRLSCLWEAKIHWVLAALFLTCIYRVVNACGWSFVLSALGEKISCAQSTQVWLKSEACRWLPGSLWSYGSRAWNATKLGVNVATASASLLLELLLTLGAWFLTATLAAPYVIEQFSGRLTPEQLGAQEVESGGVMSMINLPMVAGFGIFAIFVAMLFRPTRRIAKKKFASLREKLSELKKCRPNLRKSLGAWIFYTVMCGVNGIAFYFVIQTFAGGVSVPLHAAIGINATAWLVGFFAIFAPGGLFVREGAIVSGLLIWLPLEQAIAIALVWRVLQIVVELACLIGVYTIEAMKPLLLSLRFNRSVLSP